MQGTTEPEYRAGEDRLIVALDVPTHEEAFSLVDQLENVHFFKVGLELFLRGDVLGFLREIQNRRAIGGVFVDLKLSGDIGNTITRLVEGCIHLNVKFLTLVESTPQSITIRTLDAAKEARGASKEPRLLMVPLLSSLNADDLRAIGILNDPEDYILERGRALLGHGCDGLIVSGEAIKACRREFPDIDIVSPGIRPAWAEADDHKRHTTPQEAIRFGADYLVVGRPITKSPEPKEAARRIIEDIDEALNTPTAA